MSTQLRSFEVTCKKCRSPKSVEIKATTVRYGSSIRVKLHCTICHEVEELNLEEVGTSIEDFLSLGSADLKPDSQK